METEELRRFFEAIHPPVGYRCFAKPLEDGKWRHWWAVGPGGTLGLYGLIDKNGLYHGIAGYREKRRKGVNAFAFMCSWCDVDFLTPERWKQGKTGYENMDQFLEALRPIEKEVGQQALIVASGGGAHCYWPFDDVADHAAWYADAYYIHSLFKQYGIKGYDSSRTRDAASVLRPPGSINNKYGCTVDIIQWHSQPRAPNRTKRIAIELDAADQELQDRRYRHVTPEALVSVCGHFRRFRDTPESVSYDDYIGILSAFRRIPGGAACGLEWSRNDSIRYKEDEWVLEKLDSLTGKDAQSCETFLEKSTGESPCLQCPFKAQGLNPLKAALRSIQPSIPITEPADMPLPQGYTLKGNSILIAYERTKKGSREPGEIGSLVSNTPYYIKGLYMDPATREQTVLFGYKQAVSDKWDEVAVPQAKCLVNGGTYELAKVMAINTRLTHNYVLSCLGHYEDTCKAGGISRMLPIAKQVGWIKTDKGYGFLYGKRILDSNGLFAETAAPENDSRLNELILSLSPLAKDPEQEETLYNQWRMLACDYLADPTVPNPCKIIFLMGFVAPVIRLCVEGYRIGGVVVNAWGPSNTGKSTALRAAASIWGKPGHGSDYGLIPPIDVSEAAAYHNFGMTPHIPCFVDEFTSSKMAYDAQGIHDFVKCFADGTSPARQNQDNTQRAGRRWNTVCLCTSNERLITKMRTMPGDHDSLAAEMRFIEMEVKGPVPYSTKYDGFSRLHGLAGPRWIKYLCQPPVQEDLVKWCEANQEDSLPPKARFIRKVIALAEWTLRHLWTWRGPKTALYVEDWCAQIIPFDPCLIGWLRESQREAVHEAERVRKLSPMEQCVLQFLYEERTRLIRFERLPVGDYRRMGTKEAKARFTPVQDQANSDVEKRRDASHVYVQEDGYFYIPHEALKAMHERRIKARSFTADKDRMLKTYPIRFQRGVHLWGMEQIDRPPVTCYGFSSQLIEAWRELDSDRDGH